MKKVQTSAPAFNRRTLWPIAGIFAITGIALLLHSSAATGTQRLEAERGSVSAKATSNTGQNVSNNGYVTVGGTSGGGGLNPIPDSLPNGTWYNIGGNTFETTRLKLTAGTATTYKVTNIKTYKAGTRATSNAGGIVSFFDTATGKDYVKTNSGTSGVLLTNFGYTYKGSAGTFSSPTVSGDCATSNFETFNLTACKSHNVLRIKANSFPRDHAEQDTFHIPGNNADITFSIVNVPNEVSGQAALVNLWQAADDCGHASESGWEQGNAVTGYCVVQSMGGSTSSVFYKNHIIAGYYDKSTGHGMGMAYTKGYGDFFGGGKDLGAWNPAFAEQNFLSWEYLTSNAPQTKYFWAISGGKAELETVGKAIIDEQYF
jgi:hypothetical protein